MTSSLAAVRAAALFVLGPVLAVASAGCRGSEGTPTGGGAPPPPEVTVVQVAARTVELPWDFTGRLEGSREVEVRARVDGILLQRDYVEGGPVRRGQTLFRIDPAPYQAAVRMAEAEVAEEAARLSRAEREVARLEPLLAERAVSRRDYDNAVSDAEEARAAIGSAEARLESARLDLSYTRVEAPISGVSSRAERSEGSLVGPGEASLLTRISQVEPIWVRFSVPDERVLSLRRETEAGGIVFPAHAEVELVLPDASVHPERGRVHFRDSLIDSATGSVELRAELPNAGGALLPGQFVRVRLRGVERPDAILVPQRSVQQGQAGKFVFVVGEDGTAEARPIEVGEWLGDEWVVESGLRTGERVIVDGTVKVRPGGPVTVVEASAGD